MKHGLPLSKQSTNVPHPMAASKLKVSIRNKLAFKLRSAINLQWDSHFLIHLTSFDRLGFLCNALFNT